MPLTLIRNYVIIIVHFLIAAAAAEREAHMGLFNILFGQKGPASEVLSPQTIFSEISRIISGGDEIVAGKMSDCLSDIKKYYSDNIIRYHERGFDDNDDNDTLYWIGMVDILESCGYVCEEDYKEKKSDFLHSFGELKEVKGNSLFFDENNLKEKDSVPDWCRELDKEWKEKGWCTAALDIDSDSYLIFPCRLSDFDTLVDYAMRVGHSIDRAVNV